MAACSIRRTAMPVRDTPDHLGRRGLRQRAGCASGRRRPNGTPITPKRIVPITPRLRALLLDAFDDAHEGRQGVLRISQNNLRRTLLVAVKRAEISPIAKVFQTARQSCETDGTRTDPGHVAAAWIGHSEAASRKHYLTVPEDILDAAAGLGGELQATEQATEHTGNDGNTRETVESDKGVSPFKKTTKQAVSGQETRLGPGGFEPPT